MPIDNAKKGNGANTMTKKEQMRQKEHIAIAELKECEAHLTAIVREGKSVVRNVYDHNKLMRRHFVVLKGEK
jgi:hypothetical protein